jgi:hypothetical protein
MGTISSCRRMIYRCPFWRDRSFYIDFGGCCWITATKLSETVADQSIEREEGLSGIIDKNGDQQANRGILC